MILINDILTFRLINKIRINKSIQKYQFRYIFHTMRVERQNSVLCGSDSLTN